MLMAWSLRRARPDRPFGDCLRQAWAFEKRIVRVVDALFGHGPVQTPAPQPRWAEAGLRPMALAAVDAIGPDRPAEPTSIRAAALIRAGSKAS